MGGAAATAGDPGRALERVTAVVLTHRRPALAAEVTRSLLDVEGLTGRRVVVVVNGDGGLGDRALEASVRMVRLPENLGPAGGFRVGLVEAFADPEVRWAYLCEDDVGLFALPRPRLAALVGRAERGGSATPGAVVAYGRRFVGRGAHTENVVPPPGAADLLPVDVACWGASLVSRAVVEAGVLPDDSWFFGLEDFDFFCRVRAAGLAVLVDAEAARRVADQQTTAGRQRALAGRRADDGDESWRAYYHARNSFALARRHGRPSWHAWHLAYSARHLQRARSGAERGAIARGLWDGARGRMGAEARYRRRPATAGSGAPPAR